MYVGAFLLVYQNAKEIITYLGKVIVDTACIPYETCIIYKTTIIRWKNRLYCVLETTRRCQVQQFQRHHNTFVLSYDITISISLLLAYCFITIKLYQIDGQYIDGGGGIMAMAWVALVETVIDMRVSILFTNLPTLNVMTLSVHGYSGSGSRWSCLDWWCCRHPCGCHGSAQMDLAAGFLAVCTTSWFPALPLSGAPM